MKKSKYEMVLDTILTLSTAALSGMIIYFLWSLLPFIPIVE